MNAEKRQRRLASFLQLLSLEGLLALPFLFTIGSMARNAALFGYSPRRLLLAAGFLLLNLALLGLGSLIRRGTIEVEARLARAGEYLAEGDRHFYATSALTSLAVLGLLATGFYRSDLVSSTELIRVALIRVQSIVLWGIIALIQMVVFLHLVFPEARAAGHYASSRAIRRVAVLGAMLLGALLQWAIHGYKLDVFSWIPRWFWKFSYKTFPSAEVFLVTGILIVFVLWLLQRDRVPPALKILTLMALAYVLQLTWYFALGGGFESLRSFYLDGGRSTFHYGVSSPYFRPRQAFDNLEVIAGTKAFYITKPPGYLLFYWLTGIVLNPGYQEGTLQGNATLLLRRISYLFPLIATLPVPLIAYFAKQVEGNWRRALMPAAAFLFLPSFLLFGLQLDQVLFPALFAGGLVLSRWVLSSRQPGPGIVLGLYLYFCFFISFSLAAILVFVGIFVLLESLRTRPSDQRRSHLLGGLMILFGFSLAHLGMLVLLDYDFVARFQEAASIHAQGKGGIQGLVPYGFTIIQNTLELIMWLGAPIVVLLVSQGIDTASALRDKKAGPNDVLFVALAATVASLLIVGNTRGEVGRLWLFLNPVVALLAANQLRRLFPKSGAALYVLAILQLPIALLIFRNQFLFV